jgi:hypothetical protein
VSAVLQRGALFGEVSPGVLGLRFELMSHEAGDEQFLIEDPTRPIQLRPILASECTHRRVLPSDRLLVCRMPLEPYGVPFYAFVRLRPPQHRANTPRNVDRAILQLEEWNREIAQPLRALFGPTQIRR